MVDNLSTPRQGTRRLQFSLATILVVTTIICVRLGIWTHGSRPYAVIEIPISPQSQAVEDKLSTLLKAIHGVQEVEFEEKRLLIYSETETVIQDVLRTLDQHGIPVPSLKLTTNQTGDRNRRTTK